MKDEHDNLDSEIINEKIMIAIVQETGELTWITANEPTRAQEKQFQKIFAVTHKPSFIMNIILFIEITILKILYAFEDIDKGEDK